jgi:hypothetical protein
MIQQLDNDGNLPELEKPLNLLKMKMRQKKKKTLAPRRAPNIQMSGSV